MKRSEPYIVVSASWLDSGIRRLRFITSLILLIVLTGSLCLCVESITKVVLGFTAWESERSMRDTELQRLVYWHGLTRN